ncbi:MAG: hypothetical protein KDC35_17830 [Acidobacteria bacterium]|nr:hypothetical protein [Acidobacteriota bacterium]
MMIGLIWLCFGSEFQRIEIDVVWQESNKSIAAKMHITLSHDGRAMLLCSKALSGPLFKCWLTSEKVVVYIEPELKVFVGDDRQAFQLLPHIAPHLAREWIDLFVADALPEMVVEDENGWRQMRQNKHPVKWRIRKRMSLDHVPEKVFEPRVSDRAEIADLTSLVWNP